MAINTGMTSKVNNSAFLSFFFFKGFPKLLMTTKWSHWCCPTYVKHTTTKFNLKKNWLTTSNLIWWTLMSMIPMIITSILVTLQDKVQSEFYIQTLVHVTLPIWSIYFKLGIKVQQLRCIVWPRWRWSWSNLKV